MKQLSLLTVLILVLSGCVSTSPGITAADIDAARRSGNLTVLYEQVRDGQGSAKGLKAADRTRLLNEISATIALDARQQIEQNLTQARQDDGEVALITLGELQSRLNDSNYLPESTKTELQQLLATERNRTEQTIARLQQEFASTGQSLYDKKFALLQSIYTLSDTPEQAKVDTQRNDLIQQLSNDADSAMAQFKITDAYSLYQIVHEVAPSAPAAEKYQQLKDGGLQSLMLQLVNQGQPAAAAETFYLLTQQDNFNLNKAQILPTATDLANYFSSLAELATEQEDLATAYQHFMQSRRIKTSIASSQALETPEEARFVDALYSRYQLALRLQQPELAVAYLNTVEVLRPRFPDLARLKQQVETLVRESAMKKVSVTAFSSFSDRTAIGNTVAAKVTEYLFSQLPNDVRVVEREHLEAVLREQEIQALSSGANLNLASADLLIQGSVVEANVESSENRGRMTQRVITGYKPQPNPEFAQWNELSRSQKAKTPQPEEFVDVAVEEDVVVGVTHHRKVAVLSVSYRVVSASSAAVLYADSLTERDVATDESREGVQLGIYTAEFKNAELPSDSELLNQLVNKVATRIGDQVSHMLKNQEVVFATEAEKLQLEQNYAGAARNFARSYVISAAKGNEVGPVLEQLRFNALRTHLN